MDLVILIVCIMYNLYLYLYYLYQTQLGNTWFFMMHTQCDTLSNRNTQIYIIRDYDHNMYVFWYWLERIFVSTKRSPDYYVLFVNCHVIMFILWYHAAEIIFVSIDICMKCEYLNISWICCSFLNNKFQEFKSNTRSVETFSIVILSTNILPL